MHLTPNGYYVSTAEDAKEALQKLEEAVTPYDLVITGMVMPGMSGVDMVKEIRRNNVEIPIIVLSGGVINLA